MISNRASYVFSYDIAEPLIRDALAMSKATRTDELDCKKSFSRVASKKTPEQVLKLGLKHKNTFWSFIIRDYPTVFADIGLAAEVYRKPLMRMVTYFLWLELSVEDATILITKYNLKQR